MHAHPPSHLLAQLVSSNLFQQVAPLIVLLLVPILVLTASAHRASLRRPFDMVLDVLSAVLPWNWTGGGASEKERERRKLKKKSGRSRAEQMSLGKGDAGSSKDVFYDDEGYYPGIVNISGTYCFMDSTLQAMASLSYLQPHIEEIHGRAETLDVPTPVVDALRDVLHDLNTPRGSPRPLRPLALIEALAAHSKGKHNALFSSREHQDAQELFQLISEAVKSEALAVYKEGLKDRGLGALAPPRLAAASSSGSGGSSHSKSKGSLAKMNGSLPKEEKEADRERDGSGRERDALVRGVFDGLTANRRSCMQCGYTEAVMHFAFDNWQLAIPRQAVWRLEECLADYTRLEVLTDCMCRKCSMMATAVRLEAEAERLAAAEAATSPATPSSSSQANPFVELAASSAVSSSKRRRAREARKLATKVKQALEEGRIEEDIKGVKMERVISGASTKQAMIARPPPVLALHLNRSVHWGHYATKNNCVIHFPEILDLTPFTTSGQLSTSPSSPISAPPPPLALPLRSSTPTPATYSHPRTLYRLAAVVCHYGQHSFGHYVCFRRKPRPPSAAEKRWDPPALRCPLGCTCAECERFGPVREASAELEGRVRAGWGTGRGWLRVSDESVSECGIESVLEEGQGAFMLYYERIVPLWAQEERGDAGASAVYAGAGEARGSEETLKPRKGKAGAPNVSYAELPNGNGLADGRSISSGSGGSSLSLDSAHTTVSETRIPAADAHTSTSDALSSSPGASGKRTFGARIVRNVSARAQSGAPVDGGSDGEVQAQVNGHANGVGSSHTKVLLSTPTPTPPVPLSNGDAHVESLPSSTSETNGHLVNGHASPPEKQEPSPQPSPRSKSKSKGKAKPRARSHSGSPTRRQDARGPPPPDTALSIPPPQA